MPGFDKSRFIGLKQSEEELTCGICLAILNEPVVTPCCSQTYCGQCVRQWLTSHHTCPNDRKQLNVNQLLQPTRVVNNILDKLEIKCDFNHNGCDKHISLCQLKNHIETCRYNPEAICKTCNEKNGDFNEHDCNNNILAKNKSLELSNKELEKKYNAFVENAKKENKVKDKLICKLNKKISSKRYSDLNEENKRLKSDKREMYKKIKTVNDFANKSNLQIIDSIKQMQNEFIKIEHNLQIENESSFNLSNKTESYHEEEEVEDDDDEDEEEDNVDKSNDDYDEVDNQEDNKDMLNFGFRYRLKDVLSLDNLGYDYSPPIWAHGFKWRLITSRYIANNRSEYMKFNVKCLNCENSINSFEANCELKIVSTKVGREYVRKINHKFTYEERRCGFKKFIPWNDLLDPQNGYVTDNSITLEAVISPVIQINVESDSDLD